jgi:hypothetical protein
MTILSNYQTHDASEDEAWKQTTFTIGALTAVAIIAILFLASTS